jgi:uncharacterized protein (DUF433 family)
MSTANTNWIPSTEVAFIAELSDREVNRVVDDDVLPPALYQRLDGRRFVRLAAAFTRFYFATADDLTRSARKTAISALTERIMKLPDHEAILALRVRKAGNWKIELRTVSVDLGDIVKRSMERAELLERANRSIVEDARILGGTPVFAGTRIPIETVVASRRAGMSVEEIAESYPVTPQQIEDAEIYVQAHPPRGRPRLKVSRPQLKVIREELSPRPGQK